MPLTAVETMMRWRVPAVCVEGDECEPLRRHTSAMTAGLPSCQSRQAGLTSDQGSCCQNLSEKWKYAPICVAPRPVSVKSGFHARLDDHFVAIVEWHTCLSQLPALDPAPRLGSWTWLLNSAPGRGSWARRLAPRRPLPWSSGPLSGTL